MYKKAVQNQLTFKAYLLDVHFTIVLFTRGRVCSRRMKEVGLDATLLMSQFQPHPARSLCLYLCSIVNNSLFNVRFSPVAPYGSSRSECVVCTLGLAYVRSLDATCVLLFCSV